MSTYTRVHIYLTYIYTHMHLRCFATQCCAVQSATASQFLPFPFSVTKPIYLFRTRTSWYIDTHIIVVGSYARFPIPSLFIHPSIHPSIPTQPVDATLQTQPNLPFSHMAHDPALPTSPFPLPLPCLDRDTKKSEKNKTKQNLLVSSHWTTLRCASKTLSRVQMQDGQVFPCPRRRPGGDVGAVWGRGGWEWRVGLVNR
jgi:hypothetical protein